MKIFLLSSALCCGMVSGAALPSYTNHVPVEVLEAGSSVSELASKVGFLFE